MRVGVIGPWSPDYFADNIGDALSRIGHLVVQLGLLVRSIGLRRSEMLRC
jgi:hypothetical protein